MWENYANESIQIFEYHGRALFKMSSNGQRGRNWIFTINNFNEDDENHVINLAEDDDVNRLIAEHEHLEEGTPHIQGYISFTRRVYRTEVERRLGGRAWIQIAVGSLKQNVDYCSKEGLVIIAKNCDTDQEDKENGKLTLNVVEAARKMDPWTFEDTFPMVWVKHRNQILNVMMDNALRNVENWNGDLKAKNYWIWGPPGIGKSKWAANLMPVQNQYKKAVNKWWDGYNLCVHKIVMLEDFPMNGQMFAQHLKIWSDRYFFMAECKGSSMVVEPGRFFLIITSNFPIEACFENPEDVRAIQRRFTEIEVNQENKSIVFASNVDNSILKS